MIVTSGPLAGTGVNPWTLLKNDPKSVRNQAMLKNFRGTIPSGLEKEVRSLDIRASGRNLNHSLIL